MQSLTRPPRCLARRAGAAAAAAAAAAAPPPSRLEELVARGTAAADAIAAAPDEASRREADAFQQLLAVRSLLGAAAASDAAQVVSVVSKLPFIPQEPERVAVCQAETRQLHSAVQVGLGIGGSGGWGCRAVGERCMLLATTRAPHPLHLRGVQGAGLTAPALEAPTHAP